MAHHDEHDQPAHRYTDTQECIKDASVVHICMEHVALSRLHYPRAGGALLLLPRACACAPPRFSFHESTMKSVVLWSVTARCFYRSLLLLFRVVFVVFVTCDIAAPFLFFQSVHIIVDSDHRTRLAHSMATSAACTQRSRRHAHNPDHGSHKPLACCGATSLRSLIHTQFDTLSS